jgi:division protein CdvB (Snf7/Vps24/ESCRT-III family)
MAGGDKRQQFVSQITNATNVVYNQLGRLNMLDKRFASMERYFLEQITANIKAGKAVVIRFSTLHEFATILDTIDPTVEMIKGIHAELSKTTSAANEALSEVSSVTSDVLVNSNIKESAKISAPVDADALSILNEIEGVLEDEAKAKLPEVPTGIPASSEEEEQAEGVLVES